jgi:hypothetical protein
VIAPVLFTGSRGAPAKDDSPNVKKTADKRKVKGASFMAKATS